MKFLCYTTYSRDPEAKEPVGYCIMGDGRIWVGPTLEYVKSLVAQEHMLAEFVDDCGWILSGEEQALLDPDNQELLLYTLQIKNAESTEP